MRDENVKRKIKIMARLVWLRLVDSIFSPVTDTRPISGNNKKAKNCIKVLTSRRYVIALSSLLESSFNNVLHICRCRLSRHVYYLHTVPIK